METSYDFAKSETWLGIVDEVQTRIIELRGNFSIPELST